MGANEADVRIARAASVRAESLDLRGLNLKTLPPLPESLRDLRIIELGNNRLSKLPEQLLGLRELRRLGLGNNRIASLPLQISALHELISLDLSENRLTTVPDTIGLLARLVEISLYANRLVEVPAALFALPHLERLDLSTNRLRALPPLADTQFSSLQALDLSNNELQTLPEELSRLSALRVLNVASNRLTTLAGIEMLSHLDELDVSHNLIETLEDRGAVPAQTEELRSKASAAVQQMISGGESIGPDVRYFDAVPFQFDFDVAVDRTGAVPLIDLYYKKLSGHDVSLRLSDGSVLDLNAATRTRALDIVNAKASKTRPLQVRIGATQRQEQMQARRDFVVDALTKIRGSHLVAPEGEMTFAGPRTQTRSVVLQWSQQEHAEPLTRTVGIGFSPIDAPDRSFLDSEELPCRTSLWLWCGVEASERVSDAIGGGQPLAAAVLDDADLDVAVFTNPDGFELEDRAGVLRLSGARCFVLHPAGVPDARPELVQRRLFFKVTTPEAIGRQQLRVHLYHRGLLVQAFDVLAWIGPQGSCANPPALSVKTDYALSRSLDQRQLRTLGAHTLSIFANESPNEMSGFRFFGDHGEIASTAAIETSKIADLLDTARRALRRVSWGSDAAYDPDRDSYRYEPRGVSQGFKEDLITLAKCGFQIWDELARRLAGGAGVKQLQAKMRKPGVVQLGLKESSSQLLPLAILYDRPIDTQLKNLDAFTICPEYQKSNACFQGDCPSNGDLRIVCPSGFWGFRHSIGVPIGTGDAPEAESKIAASDVRMVASAYAGEFSLRDAHLAELETLVGSGAFEKKLTCDETVKRMSEGGFQILYFYCHGGVENKIPYVLVGGVHEDPNQIVRATLRAHSIEWSTPRSLVFINGCHTTALEPEQAIDLVNGFLETARASGVIGTEVTVFEPLATQMSKLFFTHFLAGSDVGTALLEARRSLLLGERPNPLGLVYIPFALATLKLESRTAATTSTRE